MSEQKYNPRLICEMARTCKARMAMKQVPELRLQRAVMAIGAAGKFAKSLRNMSDAEAEAAIDFVLQLVEDGADGFAGREFKEIAGHEFFEDGKKEHA